MMMRRCPGIRGDVDRAHSSFHAGRQLLSIELMVCRDVSHNRSSRSNKLILDSRVASEADLLQFLPFDS